MRRVRTIRRISMLGAVLAFALFSAIATPALGASTPLSVESMTREARKVFVADCVSTVSRAVDPVAGPRAGIVTDITLRVTDSITGEPAGTVTITQQGGEVDGLGLAVSEMAEFSRGGKYLVFLGASGRVVGGEQGALAIVNGRVGASREPLTSIKRKVRAAAGDPMSLAETLADSIVERAADAAEAVISPLATPMITAMSPTNVNAGIGDTVTISGSGFEASVGTVSFYRTSSSVVQGSIVSWSDTSITCEVPKGAGSGAVTVTNGSGLTSSGYVYDVGFSFGGSKWGTGVLTETYRINPNCADAAAAEIALVNAAAATWNAASDFTFVNGGTCSSTTNPPPSDGYNDIYWASSGFDSGTLAWNRYWYYPGTPYNQIVETDIVFNDAYSWGDGSGGTFDVQSVALHELGHSLNLSDQYGAGDASANKVMYGMIPSGSQRRTLTSDDTAGIRWIYGYSGDVTPPVMGAVTSSTHPSDSTWYNSNNVTFSWSAADAGAVTYSYVLDNTSGTVPDTVPEGTATTRSYSGLADGEWYLHVRARDEAGNWSSAQQRRVRIDVVVPGGTFAINGGDAKTSSTSVSVDSAVTGATEMRIAADGVTYGGWQAYAAKRTVTIPGVVGDNTVAVQYRDGALNTITLTDSIEYEVSLRTLTWSEISGPDRYSTARAVSREAFADNSREAVIISTGENYPDALGAGGLAGALECPILLVRKTGGLPSAVRSEIVRLLAIEADVTVYITGDTLSVSAQTEKDLKALVGSGSVKRLGGKDRYATANLIALEMKRVLDAKGIPFSGRAFLTTGLDFPDALLAAPVAYASNSPILIVGRSGADSALRSTITALGVTDIDIVGSTASVPSSVASVLDGMSGVSVRRVASASDKYAQTRDFAAWACAEEGFVCEDLGVTTGDRFPDALASGPLQGISRSPVVLVPPTWLDSDVAEMLQDNYAEISRVRFYGTTAAVSQVTRDAILQILE